MHKVIVSNLNKAFKRYPSKWARLLEWIDPFSKIRYEQRWVLKDINFQVFPGEAVGIIGINGSGKSTLLKIITGTMQPSSGDVFINGRVAALLELGIGFHPDFTGTENVYMAGQLLGFSSQELDLLLPKIIQFAEIEDYIDQPVRFYSSGMQMRLAFSVATAIRPDVLIVDEALSVGDAYFQHKCFDRIRQFKKSGTTILLVSHDKLAVQSICDRAILLSNGSVIKEGKPEEVMDFYNALIATNDHLNIRQEIIGTNKMKTVSGSGEAEIIEVGVFDQSYNMLDLVKLNQEIILRIKFISHKKISELVLGYLIKDKHGMPIFGTNTHHLNQVIFNVHSGDVYEYEFRFFANLGPGTYSISLSLHSSENHISNNFTWQDGALIFTMINYSSYFEGVAWLPPTVISKKIKNE
jgi:lipopolysaccharide transport system ATP-binding protein